MIILTENSVYRLDENTKTWQRVDTKLKGELRTESGVYRFIMLLKVGNRMILVCPPINETFTARAIITSKVKEIREDSEYEA